MVNLAVIGAGYWGPNLIRNFAQLPGCELKAIADLEKENLKKISNSYPSAKKTSQTSEVFRSQEINAVAIATTAETHYELAKEALEAGKDVFVEKPLTLNVQQGRELIQLAKKKERILMVGHLLLYHPGVKKLKEYVELGELGDLYYVYSTRVSLGQVRKSENALWSFAPHDVYVVTYLLGEKPETVIATGESYLRDGVFDVAFISLHFPDRKLAHIHVSWLDPHKIRKITLVGSKKTVVFDDTESAEKIRLYDKGVDYRPAFADYPESLSLRIGDIHIPKVDATEPLRLECEHFIDCVGSRQPPLSDGENGLEVVEVLEAAQRSLDLGGQPVKLSS